MTASALAALYLLFVLHYSVNFIYSDEWTLVPIIHAALHSHLTLGALWAQHNENRMLVPNLVIVGSALIHNYDSKSIILLGACFFIVSYGLLLVTFRTYLGRPLTPLHALSLGIVWFSWEDTENALWGFQLAWYMIVFFLMALVFLLLPDWRDRNVVLTLAIVGAVAASFSSLQGLMLWPVGLICLVWDRPRGRRRNVECGIWLVVCALTTASYFRGYTLPFTGPSRSPAFALHHPVDMAQFFLASLGKCGADHRHRTRCTRAARASPLHYCDLRGHSLLARSCVPRPHSVAGGSHPVRCAVRWFDRFRSSRFGSSGGSGLSVHDGQLASAHRGRRLCLGTLSTMEGRPCRSWTTRYSRMPGNCLGCGVPRDPMGNSDKYWGWLSTDHSSVPDRRCSDSREPGQDPALGSRAVGFNLRVSEPFCAASVPSPGGRGPFECICAGLVPYVPMHGAATFTWGDMQFDQHRKQCGPAVDVERLHGSHKWLGHHRRTVLQPNRHSVVQRRNHRDQHQRPWSARR